MKVGIFPGSMSPPHAGHVGVINLAAQENDKVIVFASAADRKRKDQIPVLGSDKEKIWKLIKPGLPQNVELIVGSFSPVRRVYELLGDDAGDQHGSDTFVIYSDPDDISRNFSPDKLQKYAGDLYSQDRILLRPISREDTIPVSGTKMRLWLQNGDERNFKLNLPGSLTDADKDKIWKMLRKSAQLEGMIRDWVRLLA